MRGVKNAMEFPKKEILMYDVGDKKLPKKEI